MEVNKIHNINFLENTLPDKCANLIIADPPYFEVKGAFDFIWSDMKAYLQDVEKWAIECKRLLADNGTLFWYGDRKNIAYAQVILDEYFEFQNHIYWQKAEKCQMEMFDTLRSFYCRGFERILMYSTKEDVLNLTGCVTMVRDYVRAEILKAKGKIVLKEVNQALGTATNGGGVASACLSLDKTEPAMITEEMYLKLQEWCKPYLDKSYQELRLEYEFKRAELEETRRPFNNFLKLSDHWKFTNDGSVNSLDHPTVKPEEMTRAMILTCSRPNDLVVVPFAGSGTECAMSVKEGRKTIGFEITEKHAKMSNDRVQNILRQPSLFVGS
jgi:DNA modification methylase